MTMEEHCPHGSGNAVWCDECEREDKAMVEYFKSQEGRERLKRRNIDPDTVVPVES